MLLGSSAAGNEAERVRPSDGHDVQHHERFGPAVGRDGGDEEMRGLLPKGEDVRRFRKEVPRWDDVFGEAEDVVELEVPARPDGLGFLGFHQGSYRVLRGGQHGGGGDVAGGPVGLDEGPELVAIVEYCFIAEFQPNAKLKSRECSVPVWKVPQRNQHARPSRSHGAIDVGSQ